MALELARIKVFDVLRNRLTGELAAVMGISGDRLELRDKTGATAPYKFGAHLSRASDDEAVDFRARLRELRRAQLAATPERKPFTAEAILRRLTKKKKR